MRSYTVYSEIISSNKDGLSSSDDVVKQFKENNVDKAESRNGGLGHYTKRQAKWDLQNQVNYNFHIYYIYIYIYNSNIYNTKYLFDLIN